MHRRSVTYAAQQDENNTRVVARSVASGFVVGLQQQLSYSYSTLTNIGTVVTLLNGSWPALSTVLPAVALTSLTANPAVETLQVRGLMRRWSGPVWRTRQSGNQERRAGSQAVRKAGRQ